MRQWVFDRPPVEWLTAGFLVLLLVSGLFGGLREVTPPEPPALELGKPLELEPMTLTVDRVYWANELPAVPKPADAPPRTGQISAVEPEGARLLVVEGTVTNTTDETQYGVLAKESVRLDGLSGFTDDDGEPVASVDVAPTFLHSLPERDSLSKLQPGITYDVAWIWDQPKGQPTPTTLTVVANDHTWRQDSLDFSWGWKDPARDTAGTFPVAEGTAR